MLRAGYDKAMQSLTDRIRAGTPMQARQLVGFAWQCVHKTPLADGRTPVGRLRGRSHFLDALLLVGCFEPDMTGLRAACWSVFELYQAALAAEVGEAHVVARKVAWSAFLAGRSGDEESVSAAHAYQEKLFRETFDFPAIGEGLSTCPCPV
jgi:hypothetical protein